MIARNFNALDCLGAISPHISYIQTNENHCKRAIILIFMPLIEYTLEKNIQVWAVLTLNSGNLLCHMTSL